MQRALAVFYPLPATRYSLLTMFSFLFYTFAFLTVVCAALVVVNKNPVNGAMFLLLSLVGMAGLFVMLEAALLAFVLILVYAGAVVALFLFIIMLLDTRPEHLKPFKPMTIAAATIGTALLALGGYTLFLQIPDAAAPTVAGPTLKNYAEMLFTTYLLPVQVVGFMLLIAMLGVIVLSKKFAPVEDPS
jgi:NADH-quinone oxidoreductase subunit J